MKVNAVTKKRDTPSGWYRIGILKELFSDRGVEVNEIIPRVSSIPPAETLKRPIWLIAALLERLTYIYKLKGADVTILQRELISTLPTVENLLPGKIILDVDDAIFLKKKGWAANNAARASIGVVCGNDYLADYFSKYNNNVRVIPTGVNVKSMIIDPKRMTGIDKKIIGWIGTTGNLKFLELITPDLVALLKKRSKDVELRIITSMVGGIPAQLMPYCTFVKWYPGIEFEELPKWSVGLMPLANSEWAKGKCSFKMLQYMSAGIPVVVSPVGMNLDVLNKGCFGYGPRTGGEWYSAIEALIDNQKLNYEYGKQARLIAEMDFSLESVVDKWMNVLDNWV